MNATEAVTLCRYVKACCPQQSIDELTPQVWADNLGNVRFEDAIDAVKMLVQRQPFIALGEITDEVKRIRAKRIAEHGDPIPPAGLDPTAELAWRQDAWRRIGDGETIDGRGVQHELQGDREQAYAIGGVA